MTPAERREERRRLLGDDVIAYLHAEVDAAVPEVLPAVLLDQLRAILTRPAGRREPAVSNDRAA